MKKILVVVDMQNDFIDGALGTSEAQAIVSKVEGKIRDFDGEIYYTRDTHQQNYLETMEGRNLPVKHCIEYTDGWRIKTEIMAASEGKKVIVIDKPTFGSMELIEIIDEEEKESIESITLIGLCTDICVISNAINLKTRFWETPIIVDSACCAGVTPQSHNNAIEAMKMCQITII